MASARSDNLPNKKLPAWKRLGLKLKSASDSELPEVDSLKRKQSPTESDSQSKRVNRGSDISTEINSSSLRTPTLSRKKSVSFTPETKIEDGDSIKQIFNGWVAEQKKQDPTFDFKNTNTDISSKTAETRQVETHATSTEGERKVKRVKKSKEERSQKGEQKKAKITQAQQKTPPTPARPFLQYLEQYSKSRDTWKFNKNHQNQLLKHAFDVSIIPSHRIHYLYAYVRGLQGVVRTRLRDTALAAKLQDLEAGASGFPEDMANKEQRQIDYEAAIKEYIATMAAAEVDQDEVGYEEGVLLGLSDKAMIKRAARRMRTERILKELEATGTSLTDEKAHVEIEQPVDGATKKLARKRKQRTMVDDSSSSDSSSDSDSSSEDDSDSETEADDGSSSSSNSSSSSSSSSESDSSSDSCDDSTSTDSDDD